MGFLSDVGSSISGSMGPILGGAVGAVGSIFNNERNIGFQREAQDYAKWLNQVTWQREDNAVQRRVADLKAAGLSPVLAAGSSAQTGSPIKIDPANVSENVGEALMSGATKAAQTQQSMVAMEAAKAQINLTNAQEKKVKADTLVSLSEAGLYGSEGGHPKYQDVWGKRVLEAINYLKKATSVDPRDVAEAKKNSKGMPWTPAWKVDEAEMKRTGKR